MLRVRFLTINPNPRDEPTQPYRVNAWGTNGVSVTSYAPDLDYIYQLWPEAVNVEYQQVEKIIFTPRFPKPEWYRGE